MRKARHLDSHLPKFMEGDRAFLQTQEGKGRRVYKSRHQKREAWYMRSVSDIPAMAVKCVHANLTEFASEGSGRVKSKKEGARVSAGIVRGTNWRDGASRWSTTGSTSEVRPRRSLSK